MAWTTTPYLGLRVPQGRPLDLSARVADALGDQVEELGRDLRLVVQTDEEVAPGQLLQLSGVASAVVQNGTGVVNAITVGSGTRVLTSLLSTVRRAGYVAGQEASTIASAPTGTVEGVVTERSVAPEEDAVEMAVASRIGYAVGGDLVLFDGTSPLVISRTLASHDPVLYDPSGIGPGNPAYSAALGRVVLAVNFAAPAKSCHLVFPVHVPADFRDWAGDDGAALPAVWFRYSVEQSGSVTGTVSDDLGHTAAGAAAGTTASAITTYEILPATLAALDPAASSLLWLKVTASSGASWPGGKTSELVRIQASAHWRYRGLRRYT